MADLRGGGPQHAPPYDPKFSQFRAVFRKIWQNRMLAPPWKGWRLSYRESWNRPCSLRHIITPDNPLDALVSSKDCYCALLNQNGNLCQVTFLSAS